MTVVLLKLVLVFCLLKTIRSIPLNSNNPNQGRIFFDAVSNWIMESDMFPIEINVPDTFMSMINGIQNAWMSTMGYLGISPPPRMKKTGKKLLRMCNKDIEFTIETEKDEKLPFLDTLLIRQETGMVKTDWYQKNTWSGRYLNFFSSLPFSYKKNTITLLTDKILKLADPDFHSSNFRLLIDTLKKNGYPEKLIHKTINIAKRRDKYVTNKETKTKFVSIPYVNGAFEKIQLLFGKYEIKVVGKGDHNLKKHLFSKIKDTIPIMHRSNVIYQVTCSCGLVYIGQTLQYLQKRMSDHQYHIRIKDSKHSAFCDHIINRDPDSEHTVDWDNVKILHIENHQQKRDVMEMIHIKTTPNAMNKQSLNIFQTPTITF